MGSLKSLIPPASPRAWTVLAGDAIAHAGFGLVFPFLVIYPSQGRGLSLSLAGLCLGVLALGDFAAGPVAGAIADRVGARRVLIASVVLTGCRRPRSPSWGPLGRRSS